MACNWHLQYPFLRQMRAPKTNTPYHSSLLCTALREWALNFSTFNILNQTVIWLLTIVSELQGVPRDNHAVFVVYFINRNYSLPQDLRFNYRNLLLLCRTFHVKFVSCLATNTSKIFFLHGILPWLDHSMGSILSRITGKIFPGQNPSRKTATQGSWQKATQDPTKNPSFRNWDFGRILGSCNVLSMGKSFLYGICH